MTSYDDKTYERKAVSSVFTMGYAESPKPENRHFRSWRLRDALFTARYCDSQSFQPADCIADCAHIRALGKIWPLPKPHTAANGIPDGVETVNGGDRENQVAYAKRIGRCFLFFQKVMPSSNSGRGELFGKKSHFFQPGAGISCQIRARRGLRSLNGRSVQTVVPVGMEVAPFPSPAPGGGAARGSRQGQSVGPRRTGRVAGTWF